MDLPDFLGHWGYPAIFVAVMLGNLGIPVPEETVLILAGYLVWEGQLRLVPALVVGICSAVMGDNLGYWAAWEYGRAVLDRHGHWILLTPERLRRAGSFITRYGPLAVFLARFVPGVRFLAGPMAGATGLRPLPFFLANVSGAMLYVPLMIGVGYLVGYGLGNQLAALERRVGQVEHLVLLLAAGLTMGFVAWRVWQRRRNRGVEAER